MSNAYGFKLACAGLSVRVEPGGVAGLRAHLPVLVGRTSNVFTSTGGIDTGATLAEIVATIAV